MCIKIWAEVYKTLAKLNPAFAGVHIDCLDF